MIRERRKSRQNSPKLIEVGKNDKNHSGNLRKKMMRKIAKISFMERSLMERINKIVKSWSRVIKKNKFKRQTLKSIQYDMKKKTI